MVEVENSIPLPKKTARTENGAYIVYPWDTIEVGQSFLHHAEYPNKRWYELRLTGKKFTTQKEGTGCRVWRTE